VVCNALSTYISHGDDPLARVWRNGQVRPLRTIMTNEDNRFSARAARYVKVGTNVGAVAAKVAGQRLLGIEGNDRAQAAELAAALGGLKGPLMKVAQLLSTIPEAHGPGLRAAPDAGRTRARLANPLWFVRGAIGGVGVTGAGSSVHIARWPPSRGKAPVSRYAIGGRG
jgi:hypothetical protein